MRKTTAAGILACVIAVAYFMPFTTVVTKDSQGRSWRVPFGMHYSSSDDDSVTFTGLRSTYAVGKDAENALHYNEEMACYGYTYFYDKGNDLSFKDEHEESHDGLMTTLTYHFEPGNTCAGWTVDDEIAWPFGDIRDVDVTAEEAMENDWLVIRDGITQNIWVYNDFSRMVKQGVYCYLRTMIIEGNEVKYVDIQALSDSGFKVLIKDKLGVSEEICRRFSDKEENGVKTVSVYRYGTAEEKPQVLFEVKQ